MAGPALLYYAWPIVKGAFTRAHGTLSKLSNTCICRPELREAVSVTDLDIWRAATILLKRYAGEAVFIAIKRADALLDLRGVQGCWAWVQITKAIADPERRTPNAGAKVH